MTRPTKESILNWLYAACIRAIRSAAQAAVFMLPTTAFTLGEINWLLVVSTAGGMAVMSLLTSLAGLPEAEDGKTPFAIIASDGKHARSGDE